MTTNAPKPVICWGMFFNSDRVENLAPYVAIMAVTSFSNRDGTMMAHGHKVIDGKRIPEHRQADRMRFYQSEDRMTTACSMATRRYWDYERPVREQEARLTDLMRQRRLDIERALGSTEIQPSELEYLRD